jgi:hypothetical protein
LKKFIIPSQKKSSTKRKIGTFPAQNAIYTVFPDQQEFLAGWETTRNGSGQSFANLCWGETGNPSWEIGISASASRGH